MKKITLIIVGLLALSLTSITYAKEKTATTNAKEAAAAISAVAAAFNVSSKAEAVVMEIPTDVTAAVEKELLSRIEIDKPEVDPAAAQVFRAPIYKVKPLLEYISVVDGEILNLNYQGTSSVLSGYLKLIRQDFVLDSEEKAKLLGKAFQHEFPYKRSDGGKFIQPVKLDKGWLLIRNEFFKNHSGLVFTTDEKGKITLVEYILKINPEDYSYEAPADITH